MSLFLVDLFGDFYFDSAENVTFTQCVMYNCHFLVRAPDYYLVNVLFISAAADY